MVQSSARALAMNDLKTSIKFKLTHHPAIPRVLTARFCTPIREHFIWKDENILRTWHEWYSNLCAFFLDENGMMRFPNQNIDKKYCGNDCCERIYSIYKQKKLKILNLHLSLFDRKLYTLKYCDCSRLKFHYLRADLWVDGWW